MEDAGNLIYILLLFFFLLSGLFKKLKPKKIKESTQPIPEIVIEDEEDFDDWFNQEEAKQSEKMEVKASVPPTHNRYSDYLNRDKTKNNRITASVSNQLEFDEEQKVNEFDIHLENVDEARKAFIYSEIFPRKY